MPDISIIMPVRPHFTDALELSLGSLSQHTRNKDNVEIFIKYDDDSPETAECAQSFKDLNITTVEMSGKYRFWGLAYYTNELAKLTSGDLIWWWSDELIVMTSGWDVEYLRATAATRNKIRVYHTHNTTCGHSYPAMTRVLYETIGKFTGHPSLDTWLAYLLQPFPGTSMVITTVRTADVERLRMVSPPPSPQPQERIAQAFGTDEHYAEISMLQDKVRKVIRNGL